MLPHSVDDHFSQFLLGNFRLSLVQIDELLKSDYLISTLMRDFFLRNFVTVDHNVPQIGEAIPNLKVFVKLNLVFCYQDLSL